MLQNFKEWLNSNLSEEVIAKIVQTCWLEPYFNFEIYDITKENHFDELVCYGIPKEELDAKLKTLRKNETFFYLENHKLAEISYKTVARVLIDEFVKDLQYDEDIPHPFNILATMLR